MLEIRKLEVLMAVMDTGSFSAAAEKVLLTQSAVSQHIADLEATLGTDLFTRGRRGVSPTSAGEVLADYARCILSLVQEAEQTISHSTSGKQLRLGGTPGVSGYVLPEWLQSFRQLHPQLSITLSTEVTATIAARILNGAFDLGFVEGDVTSHPHLEVVILEAIPQVIVVGVQHPWFGRAKIHLKALADEAFIMRPSASHTRQWIDQFLQQHALTPHVAAELDSIDAIKQAVIAGMGITILPAYVIQNEQQLGLLHTLYVVDAELERSIKVIWDNRRALPPQSMAFLAHLAKQFPALSHMTLADISTVDRPALRRCRS